MPRPAIRRIQAANLAALSAVVLASAASAQAPTPGAGMDVVHYQVRLRPYILGRSLSGETEITLRSTQEGLREAAFSANALTIDQASVG
ncbi:MAG: M1 family peptidase, partial [Proteobacteria bacterium]|nr:M1 family peptidase [Pseudomonadota bacterium]